MPQVRIRPAQEADRLAVEAICARAWEGEDYIPSVWDEWLADPQGQLAVAELEGRVAGLGKLSRIADDEWWLEGLRVDPDCWRQGVAGKLQAHLVGLAGEKGSGVLRYGTHSRNEPVHRIAAHAGFRHVASYVLCRASAVPVSGAISLRRLDEADLAAAWALAERSPRHRASQGLYEVDWRWRRLTRERLAGHLAAGDAWGVDGAHGLAALALIWSDEQGLQVGHVDGAGDSLVEALRRLRALASRQGHDEVHATLVLEAELVTAAGEVGYERVEERDRWIMELEL